MHSWHHNAHDDTCLTQKALQGPTKYVCQPYNNSLPATYLLNIPNLSGPSGLLLWLPIDQYIACDAAYCLAPSNHIHQCSFASTLQQQVLLAAGCQMSAILQACIVGPPKKTLAAGCLAETWLQVPFCKQAGYKVFSMELRELLRCCYSPNPPSSTSAVLVQQSS